MRCPLGKRKKSNRHSAPWTKPAQFPGQATFDLVNDMKQVPFTKSCSTNPEELATRMQGFPAGLSCSSCGAMEGSCSCDPLMRELHKMQEEARMETYDVGSAPQPSLTGWNTRGLIPRDRLPKSFDKSTFGYSIHQSPSINPEVEGMASSSPGSSPSFNTFTNHHFEMILQPETRPTTLEQLLNEVKGIYARLVMVEKKCVEIDQQ